MLRFYPDTRRTMRKSKPKIPTNTNHKSSSFATDRKGALLGGGNVLLLLHSVHRCYNDELVVVIGKRSVRENC